MPDQPDKGTDAVIGGIAVRSAVAVTVLYVIVSMMAALAEIGPRGVTDPGPYTDNTPGTEFDAEFYDLRTEEIVP